MIDRDLPPLCLLWAHVERRADEVAGKRQRLLAFEARQSEVENAKSTLVVQDQVGGLYVAVDDALGVRVLEAAR